MFCQKEGAPLTLNYMLRLFFLALLLITVRPMPAQALPQKVKAMLTCAGYGTVGGALVGTAAMAFGAKPRAVFVGASLGLYAGLLFGTYVIVSHEYAQESAGEEEASLGGPRWNAYAALSESHAREGLAAFPRQQYHASKPLAVNFLNLQF